MPERKASEAVVIGVKAFLQSQRFKMHSYIFKIFSG